MLAYVMAETGDLDALLAGLAGQLRAEGRRVAGAIQVNRDRPDAGPCHMDLEILTGGQSVRISQNLGALSRGCRLDPAGLVQAVGLVEQAIAAGGIDLLIINKFGKQEIDGRGFRPVIGTALGEGVNVLVGIRPASLAAFLAFAGDLATPAPARAEDLVDWCRDHLN